MNKAEVVTAMAEKSGLSKKDCETALNAMTEADIDALKAHSVFRFSLPKEKRNTE